MSKEDSFLKKGKQDYNLLIFFLQQGNKIWEFTYFLLYDYWTAELIQILNLIMGFKAYIVEKL